MKSIIEEAWRFTRRAVSQVWQGRRSVEPLATPSQGAGEAKIREQLFAAFLDPSSPKGSVKIKPTRARIKYWSAQARAGDAKSIAALGAVRTVRTIQTLQEVAMDPKLGNRNNGLNPCEAAVHALWQGLRNPVASPALVQIATSSPNKDARLLAAQVPRHPYEDQRAAVLRAVQAAIDASPEELDGIEVPLKPFLRSL